MAREYYGGAFTSYTLMFDTPLHECDPAASTNCIPFDPSLMTPEGIAAYVAANPRSGGEVNLLSNDLKTPYSDQFSLGMRKDRKSVVEGKSVSVRGDLGGRRIIKKQNKTESTHTETIRQ